MPREGGHHRGLEQFGQFNQFGIGLGVKGTLAGVDYRVAGIAQSPGRRGHIGGIALGNQGAHPAAPVKGRFVHFLEGHIRRYFHHHRADPALAQAGKGPAHYLAGAGRGVQQFYGFGNAAVVGDRIEVGLDALPFPGFAQGQQQEGRGVGVGGGDAGIGVFRAGAVLHGKDAELFPVSDPAVAISNAHAYPFLAADDGADAGGGGRFDDRSGGEATEILHSFPFQDFGYSFDGFQLLTLVRQDTRPQI